MNLPLRYFPAEGTLVGATWGDVEGFYRLDPIRQIERASIRVFMEAHRELFRGRVLDFGAGLGPYQDLVDGQYFPVDKGGVSAPSPGRGLPVVNFRGQYEGPFDVIMCNQVLQYLEDVEGALELLHATLRPGGHLVMTYATNWDEVEETDLRRFTKAGMTVLLERAGFKITVHERRAEVAFANFKFPLGYGVVCTRS